MRTMVLSGILLLSNLTPSLAVDLRVWPIRGSGDYEVSGNEITVERGDGVLLEVTVSNWQYFSEQLRSVRLVFDISGGTSGTLTPLAGCDPDGVELCSICDDDADGLFIDECRNRCRPYGQICSNASPTNACESGTCQVGQNLPTFPDFFGNMPPIHGVGVGADQAYNLETLWTGSAPVGVLDDFYYHYVASLVLQISPDAAGTFAVSLVSETCCDIPFSFVRNQNGQPFVQPTNCFGAWVHVLPSFAPSIVHGTDERARTSPCSGYLDPRIESTNGVEVNRGLDRVRLEFNEPIYALGGGDVGADSFVVTHTAPQPPPTVASVVDLDGDRTYFEVRLSRFVSLQHWTTVRAAVQNADGVPIDDFGDLGGNALERDRVDVGALPGDVDQGGVVTAIDLLRFRQALLGFCVSCPHCGGMEWYFDTDRNGVAFQPLDLIRLRQILLGVPPATRSWSMLPHRYMLASQP